MVFLIFLVQRTNNMEWDFFLFLRSNSEIGAEIDGHEGLDTLPFKESLTGINLSSVFLHTHKLFVYQPCYGLILNYIGD